MAPDPIVLAEATEAAKRRIQNGGLQLRDQVIAISEDAINGDLKARYNSNLLREKDARLRKFNHALPALGEITASLDAPRVKLVTANNQEVLFFLDFAKGEFDFWTGFGPSAVQQKQNIDGWSICFRTNFSLSELAEVPPKIKEKIDPAVIREGSYTVARLLLTFSAAAIAKINWADSVCPGLHDNPNLQFASMNMFEEYMKTYMRFMATGPYSVLGYAIKVKSNIPSGLEPPIPSFPLTNMVCQTQAYSPCLPDFANHSSRSSLDQFLYLGMTEDRELPKTPFETASAVNWCYSGLPASLCISRRVLWERFFAIKLALLNERCVTLANDLLWWVYRKEKSQASGNVWKIDSNSKPTSFPWVLSDDQISYSFVGKNYTGSNYDGWKDNVDAKVLNAIKWNPGTGKAHISVDIWVKRYEWSQGHRGSSDSIWSTEGSITWNIDLNVAASDHDASMIIALEAGKVDMAGKNTSTQDFWDWGGGMRERNQKEVDAVLTENINFGAIGDELSKALSGTSSFVFPAGETFAPKNPTFNNVGDLLVELRYKSQGINIEDDFHLQIIAPGKDYDKRYLKVTRDGDDAPLELVATQTEGTVFTLDDGNLCEWISDTKNGRYATIRPGDNSQSPLFTSPSAAKARGDKKLEFSTTGSGFAYSADGAVWFNNCQVSEQGQVLLMFSAIPGTSFALQAIY